MEHWEIIGGLYLMLMAGLHILDDVLFIWCRIRKKPYSCPWNEIIGMNDKWWGRAITALLMVLGFLYFLRG